jgi:hypothetical protein
MGQEDKLAPEDMKKAAEEYDDRLAMADTLQEQEAKTRLAQKSMAKIDGAAGSSQASSSSKPQDENYDYDESAGGYCCTIS